MSLSVCFSPGDHLSSQQGPPPLPPAPPPHKQHPSITSLSRSSLANQRSPSPPPTAGLAADLQSTAECVQLQDSWVLGSNVALESRQVTHNDLPQSWAIQVQVLSLNLTKWYDTNEQRLGDVNFHFVFCFHIFFKLFAGGKKVLGTALLHPLQDKKGAGFFSAPNVYFGDYTSSGWIIMPQIVHGIMFFLLSVINKVNASPPLRIMSSFLLSVCTHN